MLRREKNAPPDGKLACFFQCPLQKAQGRGVKAGDSALVPGSNEDNSKDENQQTERNVIERIDR